MKKVPYSAYLQEIEPKLKQLLELLEPEYGFVSILSADTTGAAYRIGQKNKVIMEPMTCERGSVVRTVPTSHQVDAVAALLGVKVHETPVGQPPSTILRTSVAVPIMAPPFSAVFPHRMPFRTTGVPRML